ncbi:MAG: hypothetical protein P9M14_09950 [Candidatus Alcyoniella australis]|nr:hypothetical protein [Candidatus Alcyoniella australis]
MADKFAMSFIYLLPRGQSQKVVESLPHQVEKPDDRFELLDVDGLSMIDWQRNQEDGAGLHMRMDRDDFLFAVLSYAEFPEHGVDVLVSFRDPGSGNGRSVLFSDVLSIEYLPIDKRRITGNLVLLYNFPRRFDAVLG